MLKPRHFTATALVLFVAAMVAWLIVRSHVLTPDAADVSRAPKADHPAPSLASRDTPSPTPATAEITSSAPSPQAAPSLSLATPALSASTALSVASTPPVSSTPVASDPAVERTDAASLNAIKVRRMITDYHTLGGENPVGTNAEIMATVMGKNSRQAILGPPEGFSLNGKGELVDEWGTPYFFHQLSKDVMEIHSAGPDKIMGTADDIVVR